MRARVLWWVSLALVALPAAAQSTRARLDDLDLRVGQLEETVKGQALVELSQRIDTLEAEARTLRGDLDVLQKDNESLRKQQADLAADFDRRIEALEARMAAMGAAATASGDTQANAPAQGEQAAGESSATATAGATAPIGGVAPTVAAAPTGPAAPTVAGAAVESPEVLYGRAFDALKAAKYPEAISGMGDFLQRFPSHALADNAQYWIGQAYYVTRDYAKAVEAFAAVGTRSPDSAKAPDALLKKGLAEFELGRIEAARTTFNEVVRRYSQNDAARLAREQLSRMR